MIKLTKDPYRQSLIDHLCLILGAELVRVETLTNEQLDRLARDYDLGIMETASRRDSLTSPAAFDSFNPFRF